VFCKDCLSIRRQEKKEELEKRQEQKAEESKKIDKTPSISLFSLSQARPVDFKGRPEKIRENKPVVHKIKLSEQEKEEEMDEDEIIDFSRRSV
jgi:hypothetical protein